MAEDESHCSQPTDIHDDIDDPSHNHQPAQSDRTTDCHDNIETEVATMKEANCDLPQLIKGRSRRKKWNTDQEFVYTLPRKYPRFTLSPSPQLQKPPSNMKAVVMDTECTNNNVKKPLLLRGNDLFSPETTSQVTVKHEGNSTPPIDRHNDRGTLVMCSSARVKKEKRTSHQVAGRKKGGGSWSSFVVRLQEARLVYHGRSSASSVRDGDARIKSFLPLPFAEPRVVGSTSLFNCVSPSFYVSSASCERFPSFSRNFNPESTNNNHDCDNLWTTGKRRSSRPRPTRILTDLKTGLRNSRGKSEQYESARGADLCESNEAEQGSYKPQLIKSIPNIVSGSHKPQLIKSNPNIVSGSSEISGDFTDGDENLAPESHGEDRMRNKTGLAGMTSADLDTNVCLKSEPFSLLTEPCPVFREHRSSGANSASESEGSLTGTEPLSQLTAVKNVKVVLDRVDKSPHSPTYHITFTDKYHAKVCLKPGVTNNIVPTHPVSTTVPASVPTSVPTDPVPTSVPTEPVPTSVPTDPVLTSIPTDPVPTSVSIDPVPTDPVFTDPVPTSVHTDQVFEDTLVDEVPTSTESEKESSFLRVTCSTNDSSYSRQISMLAAHLSKYKLSEEIDTRLWNEEAVAELSGPSGEVITTKFLDISSDSEFESEDECPVVEFHVVSGNRQSLGGLSPNTSVNPFAVKSWCGDQQSMSKSAGKRPAERKHDQRTKKKKVPTATLR